MKIVRKLMTVGPISHFAPLLAKMDSFFLCILHRAASKSGMRNLAAADHVAAAKTLAAISSVSSDDGVEKARARLLKRKAPLNSPMISDNGTTIADACAVSKSPRQAGILASLARQFKPRYAIELGTNVGISSAYLAPAVSGTLFTLEGSSARIAIAKEVHASLNITNINYIAGLFKDTLVEVLRNAPQIDFAFIDGHHEYYSTIDYYEQIVMHARAGAVFIFDDIRWSKGMEKAWSQLKTDPRFSLVVDLWTMGVCVLREGGESRISTGPITCY